MLDKSRSVRDALRAAKSGPTRPVVPAKRKHFDDGGGADPRDMFDPELGWVGGSGDQTEGAASTGPVIGPQPFQMAALDVQQTQAAPMQQPSPTVDLTQQPTQVAANQAPQAPQAPQPSTDQGPNWKTWWGYTPTQTDYDKMLKLSLGEAGVNTYDQYRGVYEAMGNRHASGAYGGDTIADLITPKQTAGITQTSRINDLMTSTDPTKQKAYQTAKQALDDYLTEGQNKVLTTQTDWRGFQNNKPSPGTGFENKYIPGGTETGYQYNTFYDPEKNPALADKLAGMLAEKGGIKTYNPYTPTYAQDVLGKEAQLAAAEDMGPTFTQQAALDTQSQQDAINAAQQAATQQAQNFDTGIVQNAATDFNYLNPLQGTGIGDFTNMITGVDYTNPTPDVITPSVTDFSYNAFDTTPAWSWTPERRGGRTYAVGGPAPYVPPRKESWTDRTNKELQKEVLSPEKEDEASDYYQKWQSEQSPQQKRQLASGGKAYPLDKDRGEKLTYMKPKEFLKKARPLNMDKDDKKIIKGFKHSMEKGHKLDPLALYPHNRENGRHRALAAKELGIKKVPVHNYRKEADGGSIVDKALMLTSRRLAAAKAPK